MSLSFIVFLITGYLMTANMAQECRTLASVDNSATTLQTNVNVGGHVWQHVYNITKPTNSSPTDTQNGKTLFIDFNSFRNAWTSFKSLTTGNWKICPQTGGTVPIADAVASANVGVYTAYKCNGVNTNNLCNNTILYNMGSFKVVFCYKYYRAQWIMRTAYPKNRPFNDEDDFDTDCSEVFSLKEPEL